jgi:hypothetical protein
LIKDLTVRPPTIKLLREKVLWHWSWQLVFFGYETKRISRKAKGMRLHQAKILHNNENNQQIENGRKYLLMVYLIRN